MPVEFVDNEFASKTPFPDGVIKKGIKTKIGYPDYNPIGSPAIHTLEFEINLNAFVDNEIEDWSIIRDWILREQTPAEMTINMRVYHMPNRWILQKLTDDGYTKWRFDGTQDKVERDWTFDKTGECLCKITCVDMRTAVFSRIPYALLDMRQPFSAEMLAILEATYNLPVDLIYRDSNNEPLRLLGVRHPNGEEYEGKDAIYDYIRWGGTDGIKTFISQYCNNLYKALTRNEDAVFDIYTDNDLFTHISLFEHNYKTDSLRGAQLDNDDIMFLFSVRNFFGNTLLDGLFSASDMGWKEHRNLRDLYRLMAEGLVCRTKFRYEDVTGNLIYTHSKIYDSPEDEDPVTFVRTDFIGKVNIKQRKSDTYITNTGSYIKGSNNELVDEFGYEVEGSNAAPSGELSHILSNLPATDVDPFNISATGAYHSAHTKDLPIRKIFYRNDADILARFNLTEQFIRVHDDCVIDLGGADSELGDLTIDSDLGYTPAVLPDFTYDPDDSLASRQSQFRRHIQAWTLQRVKYAGLPYVCAKAHTTVFSAGKAAILTAKTDVTKVDFEDFGKTTLIDPNDLMPEDIIITQGNFLDGHIYKDGIITNLEIDYSTGIVEDLKIFIRGV